MSARLLRLEYELFTLLMLILVSSYCCIGIADDYPVFHVSIDNSCGNPVAVGEECIISINVESPIDNPRANVSGVVRFSPSGGVAVLEGYTSMSGEGYVVGWALIEPGEKITLAKIRVKFLKPGDYTIRAVIEYVTETGVRGEFTGLSQVIRVIEPRIDVLLSSGTIIVKPGSAQIITYRVNVEPSTVHVTLHDIKFETPTTHITLTYTRRNTRSGNIIVKADKNAPPGDYDIIARFFIGDSEIIKKLRIHIEGETITPVIPTPQTQLIILIPISISIIIILKRLKRRHRRLQPSDDTRLLP